MGEPTIISAIRATLSTAFAGVAYAFGIDPILLMLWSFAATVCMFHVWLLWWMPPSWVTFFCSEKNIFLVLLDLVRSALGFSPPPPPELRVASWWTKFIALVERLRTTSLAWWRVMAAFKGVWIAFMAGPYSLAMRLLGNPDTSRLVGMGIVAPIGVASLLWIFMDPGRPYLNYLIGKVPSGWIEPPGSNESIVWVTFMTAALMCGGLELVNALYPPLVKLFLGDVPIPIFHAGILVALGFACVMAGIEVDGNLGNRSSNNNSSEISSSTPNESEDEYANARKYHLAFLLVSLFAVVVAYLRAKA